MIVASFRQNDRNRDAQEHSYWRSNCCDLPQRMPRHRDDRAWVATLALIPNRRRPQGKEMTVNRILSASLCLIAFTSALAGAQTTKITTEYLMTLYAPLDPPQKIDSSLTIYNVGSGGWVKGPKIKGTLVAPAADWIRLMPGGNLRQDVRLTIKTDDGALIYLTYNGIISRSEEVAKRVASGERLTSADEYFLMVPTMETSSSAYFWLNRVQCVGKMVEVKTGDNSFVKYDIFVVH
jgi:hypothetical protein